MSSNGDLSSSGSVTAYEVKIGLLRFLSSSTLVNQGQTLARAKDEAQCGYSASLSGDGKRPVIESNGFNSADVSETGLCAVYELQVDDWMLVGNRLATEKSKRPAHTCPCRKMKRSQLQQEHLHRWCFEWVACAP